MTSRYSRDKSPKRSSPTTLPLDVLKVVMESGWIGPFTLRKLYKVSKKIQALFGCFNIRLKEFNGTLHIPSLTIWADIFHALGYWNNFRRRNSQVPAKSTGSFLLVLLMYVDRTETALYIVRSLNVHWEHWVCPVQINGRLDIYEQLKHSLSTEEQQKFNLSLAQNPATFYVSSELYQHRNLWLNFNAGLDIWKVMQFLSCSMRDKSLVAFEFCIQLMKTYRKNSAGFLNCSSCGDAVKSMEWRHDSFLTCAQDWTNPNAIKLARWLRSRVNMPYLELCESLQSEAELRASFDKEEGRWPPV
jgi:hypothetical protein